MTLTTSLAVRARRLLDLETLLLIAGTPYGAPAPIATREAGPAEIDELSELYGTGRRRIRRWRRRRRLIRNFDRGDSCYVVDEAGRIAACAWLAARSMRLPRYRLRVRVEEGDVYLHGVCVRADLRRRGLGERLIQAVREAASTRGATRILGHISPRNPATPHIFVEKLGDEVLAEVRVLVLLDRFGLPLRSRYVGGRGSCSSSS